ncbi:dihydrofolate reductase [Patescibacteria group bacterium]|nr:dihydrofolate reductase [Patescibacteria group bacterium]
MIIMIVAMDRNRLIGDGEKLLWHLPRDFARFKKITMGYPIIMGRKTHRSIGKALPGRENIILTRDKNFTSTGCNIFHSLEEVLSLEKKKDIFVIGGGEIYQTFLPLAQKLYVTQVHGEFEGDIYFPLIPEHKWQVISRETSEKDSKNPYDMTFLIYERKN